MTCQLTIVVLISRFVTGYCEKTSWLVKFYNGKNILDSHSYVKLRFLKVLDRSFSSWRAIKNCFFHLDSTLLHVEVHAFTLRLCWKHVLNVLTVKCAMCLWLRIKPQTSYTAVFQQNRSLQKGYLKKMPKKNSKIALYVSVCIKLQYRWLLSSLACCVRVTNPATLNLLKCTQTRT